MCLAMQGTPVYPWSRKTPHASGQQSPCATTAEPTLESRALQRDTPLQWEARAPQWRAAPLAEIFLCPPTPSPEPGTDVTSSLGVVGDAIQLHLHPVAGAQNVGWGQQFRRKGEKDETVAGSSLGSRSSLGTFEFQGPAWQGSWVSPCLGIASLGTPLTPHPGWSLQGCVSVSYFYPVQGGTLSITATAWLFEPVLSNQATT